MSDGSRPAVSRLVLLYTSIRVALFLAVFCVLIPVPLNVIIRLAIAFVVSALLAYPLARRQRADMVEALEARRQRRVRPMPPSR